MTKRGSGYTGYSTHTHAHTHVHCDTHTHTGWPDPLAGKREISGLRFKTAAVETV